MMDVDKVLQSIVDFANQKNRKLKEFDYQLEENENIFVKSAT